MINQLTGGKWGLTGGRKAPRGSSISVTQSPNTCSRAAPERHPSQRQRFPHVPIFDTTLSSINVIPCLKSPCISCSPHAIRSRSVRPLFAPDGWPRMKDGSRRFNFHRRRWKSVSLLAQITTSTSIFCCFVTDLCNSPRTNHRHE